jgi:hypothetical protein
LPATVTPLAQFAVTVPEIVDAVCVVMSHLTSEQLPSGSPAIDGEPHVPPNADAGEVVDVPPVEPEPPVVDDPPDVVPAAPALSEGAVGVKSFEVFSNAQPVASIEASNRLKKHSFFITGPYSFVLAHAVLVRVRVPAAQNSQEIAESV